MSAVQWVVFACRELSELVEGVPVEVKEVRLPGRVRSPFIRNGIMSSIAKMFFSKGSNTMLPGETAGALAPDPDS